MQNLKWVNDVKTPCYVIDIVKLKQNLELLKRVENEMGCKVLLAQKAFSTYKLYPLLRRYISGTTASGLYEARLGYSEMGGETHVFSPAYTEADFAELIKICSHIVFNSYSQWDKYKKSLPKSVSAGLRINPEFSTGDHAIYDPCSPHSRLGATLESIKGKDLVGIDGLHFHTLCQQNADALSATIDVVIDKFLDGNVFPTNSLKWVNLGGGHHITREDYDLGLLAKCIARIKDATGGAQVYLEPGEAVALNAGYLVTEVLDVLYNDMDIAILDASTACHMPDVLEMPYRPELLFCNQGEHTVRLGGNTCLAGDIVGDYSFDKPLKSGDRLVFADMAIYTMVKNNTFNGTPLPNIAILHENNEIETIKEFGYDDFKQRL